DNLTFSLEIDFIPDIEDGRKDFEKRMEDVAKRVDASFHLDSKSRPVIAELAKENIEKALNELGLLAFGMWPSCILTCTIATALPIRAVGMSDGWDVYTGTKTFFAFAQFPADVITIMVKACTFYLENSDNQSFDEFIASTGYESFRDHVLGNTLPGGFNTTNDEYNSSQNNSNLPSLSEGDFIRPEHNVMQIIDVYPEMGEFLMEYGMSCVGCFVSYDENLWQASQAHGMDVFEILGEMNEYIADKYNKSLLTKETPMEDILTLYPQLLTVFQHAGIQMPKEIKTPIGLLCQEAGVDFDKFIETCNSRLRGEEN
ncbi:MAG: DUF1858 domain-containing protein, partial [Dialister sp.]|nr:DUF1858 domain-containing protein [Dialister sp.]